MERFIFLLSLADNTQFYTIFLTIFLRKRKEKYFMCNVNTFLAHKNSRRIMSGLPAANALNMDIPFLVSPIFHLIFTVLLVYYHKNLLYKHRNPYTITKTPSRFP